MTNKRMLITDYFKGRNCCRGKKKVTGRKCCEKNITILATFSARKYFFPQYSYFSSKKNHEFFTYFPKFMMF